MGHVNDIYDFVDEWQTGHYSKKILIEGDSWVSHPFPGVSNLSSQIEQFDSDDHLVLNIASPGDEASSIFRAHGDQMKRLKRLLKSEQWGEDFDLIILSAAGNDIVGPEIVEKGYLRNKRDFPGLLGKELLTTHFYSMLTEVVKGYGRFLNLRNDTVLNKDTPVITHVYSYLQPREVGTHIGPFEFNKGWIKVHFKHQGIKDDDEQHDILQEMLDAFYRRLKKLEATHSNFLVADTRKVLLKQGMPDVDFWFDEIHPNTRGFKKIAKHIRKEAIAAGLWSLA
jgi:hypothetical protein